MVGVDLPQKAAGFLMKKELEFFAKYVLVPLSDCWRMDLAAKLNGSLQSS